MTRRRADARRHRRLPERRHAAHHPRLREDHDREAPAHHEPPKLQHDLDAGGRGRARGIGRARRHAGTAGRRRRRREAAGRPTPSTQSSAPTRSAFSPSAPTTRFDNPKFVDFVLLRRRRQHTPGARRRLPGRPPRADDRPHERQSQSSMTAPAWPANVVNERARRALRRRDDARHRPAAADQRDQRQDEERARRHGDIRRRHHGARALRRLPRALAAALAAGRAHRLRLGVRADGLRRHPADDRDDLRTADPHRARRRLRDPDAQPHRR